MIGFPEICSLKRISSILTCVALFTSIRFLKEVQFTEHKNNDNTISSKIYISTQWSYKIQLQIILMPKTIPRLSYIFLVFFLYNLEKYNLQNILTMTIPMGERYTCLLSDLTKNNNRYQ